MVAGFGAVTAAAQAAENAALRFGSALQSTQYDKDKYALDSSGQRLTMGGQLKPPDESGGWTFVNDASGGAAGKVENYSHIVPGVGYWKRTGGSSGSTATAGNGTAAGTPLLGSGSAGGTRAVGTSASGYGTGSTGGSYTVNINMSGNKTTINAASANDAQRLVDFLQSLESAARSAGG